MSWQIRRDDREPLGQQWRESCPGVRGCAGSVNEKQRWTMAKDLNMPLYARRIDRSA